MIKLRGLMQEATISTMEAKQLSDIQSDIDKCSGSSGISKLVKLQGFWNSMSKSNKIRSKVLKAIEDKLNQL